MGNSSSSGRTNDETVDFGALVPQGVYTGAHDWNEQIVGQSIIDRRLAPFYRPLEEYDPSWDDAQILAARRPPPSDDAQSEPSTPAPSKVSHGKRPSTAPKEGCPAAVYHGALECPICFLYYPSNINYSRCCGQAICTECFVQIKRIEPTTTHAVSEPAACPYCVQDNFGIVYKPPPWRAGMGSDGYPSPFTEFSKSLQNLPSETSSHKRRQKSYSADSPEVVTTDHIRPDWEAKLAAVKAAVARRANRRIIMRQVGDRLIPIGVTSGRIHQLTPEEAAAVATETEENGSSRRSRRRQQNASNGFDQYMGMAGQDLEELMMMEAMRLSLLEHEEHQRKQAEEERQRRSETQTPGAGSSSGADSSTVPASSPIHVPQPSSSPPIASSRSLGSTPMQSRDLSSSLNAASARPYSALSAALSAASTASAVLSASQPPSQGIQNGTTASGGTSESVDVDPPRVEPLPSATTSSAGPQVDGNSSARSP